MTMIAYPRHYAILIAASLMLPLLSVAVDSAPAGDARFFSFFALIGAIHATSMVMSLRDRAPFARGIAFVALVATLSLVTPFLGFLAAPALPYVVPPILWLFPFLKSIGDSTPGDSVRFFVVVTSASACGALGYGFLVRWFWLRPLRLSELIRAVTFCLIATSLAFAIPVALTSINRDVAGYLPAVLWWFAFSGALYWSESRGNRQRPVQIPSLGTA